MAQILARIEAYYDAAPRPSARACQIGPFTLFVAAGSLGFPYYARPRLDLAEPITANQVETVRAEQRRRGVPEALEWVDEITPSLLPAALAAGMRVEQCPLLVLAERLPLRAPARVRVEILEADHTDFDAVLACVHSGFGQSNQVRLVPEPRRRDLVACGLMAVAGAYLDGEPVGGGMHSPRSGASELTGIAVLPRARRLGIGAVLTGVLAKHALGLGVDTIFLGAQDDAVARVYERVGFRRVGTACMAEPVDAAAADAKRVDPAPAG